MFSSGNLEEALTPLRKIPKYFIDLFKPYKVVACRSPTFPYSHVLRDFLQPVFAIGYLLAATALFIIFPFACLIDICLCLWDGKNLKEMLSKLGLTFLGTVSLIIYSSIMIAAAPLTWCIKMPLRGIITLIEGIPKIEENAAIQKQVEQIKSELSSLSDTETNSDINKAYEKIFASIGIIQAKYKKKYLDGQKTKIELKCVFPGPLQEESTQYLKKYAENFVASFPPAKPGV